jgi:hypothetical protein
MEESRLLDSVSLQLNVLCSEMYINPRAGFVIVATRYFPKTTDFLRKGFDMLWSRFEIENFIIVLPSLNQSQYSINENVHRLVEMKNYDIFYGLSMKHFSNDTRFVVCLSLYEQYYVDYILLYNTCLSKHGRVSVYIKGYN